MKIIFDTNLTAIYFMSDLEYQSGAITGDRIFVIVLIKLVLFFTRIYE